MKNVRNTIWKRFGSILNSFLMLRMSAKLHKSVNVNQMKRIAGSFVFAMAVGAMVISCTSQNEKEQSTQNQEAFTAADIHLGEHMRDIQYYTLKLGLSLQHKNGPLAQFYLDEVEEAYQELSDKSIVEEGIDISALLHQLLEPGLKAVDSVLLQNDTSRFIPVYHALIEKCNSCHREAKHEFIVIQMPEENFNGQDFRLPSAGNAR